MIGGGGGGGSNQVQIRMMFSIGYNNVDPVNNIIPEWNQVSRTKYIHQQTWYVYVGRLLSWSDW